MIQFEKTNSNIPLFVVSDGTGETAEKIISAVLTQYKSLNVRVVRYKTVRTNDQVEAILEEASIQKAALIYTVVDPNVRVAILEGVKKFKIKAVDVLGPVLDTMSQVYEAKPSFTPGLLHQVDESYYRRIDAMEFAVKQDDGSSPENLRAADIVLVGVSRTSKTPLSIFLSHKGWKVANVPLVYGIQPPQELFSINQNRVVGLIIDPEALAQIRKERLARMGSDPMDEYASIKKIRDEIEWSRQLFSRNRRWPTFDVTNKALEETASEIERRMRTRLKRIEDDS
jgi:hypothetical protein